MRNRGTGGHMPQERLGRGLRQLADRVRRLEARARTPQKQVTIGTWCLTCNDHGDLIVQGDDGREPLVLARRATLDAMPTREDR